MIPRLNPIPAPNLVNNIPQSEKVQRPAGFYKSITIDVLFAATAVGWSFLLREFIEGRLSGLWMLLDLTAFLVFAVFGWLLAASRSRRMLMIALASFGSVIFFLDQAWWYIGAAATGGFLFMYLGETLARGALENTLEFKFLAAIRPMLNRYLTAFILVGVLLYLPFSGGVGDFLGEENFARIYGTMVGPVENYYLGEVELRATFGEFARSYTEYSLRSSSLYRTLPAPAQNLALNEAVKGLTQAFSTVTGGEIKASDSMPRVIYGFLERKIDSWREKFGNQFLIIWAVALFFSLRALAAAYYLFLAACAFVTYQIFLAFNFVHVVAENRVKERVEYS